MRKLNGCPQMLTHAEMSVLHLKILLISRKALLAKPFEHRDITLAQVRNASPATFVQYLSFVRLVQEDSKQLLHHTAPLGAYVWSQLGRGTGPEVRLDVLHISTRRCSLSGGDDRLSPDAFRCMSNFSEYFVQ